MAELLADILHMQFGCTDDLNPCSFGFYLRVQGAAALDPSKFSLIVYDWFNFVQPTFLDCMHTGASFGTCRLTRGLPLPYVHVEQLAPNLGAQDGSVPMAVAAGLYMVAAIGGRGSGSRLHLPGCPSRFVEADAKLSGYGLQQLTFAAQALADFPARLTSDLGTPTELVTYQTRRGGKPLAVPEYSPTVAVRPTLRLTTVTRRMRASGGFSPP